MKARNVTNSEELEQPGDFCFIGIYNAPADVIGGMIVKCPNPDCGQDSAISFPNSNYSKEGQTWTWDGNKETPTINPSVRKSCCGWHGWLRNGEWVVA